MVRFRIMMSTVLRTLLCVTGFALVLATSAGAVDLGVQGTVWTIVEVDMRELLLSEITAKDWSGPQAELEKSTKSYFDHLPHREPSMVSRTDTRWYDPSITLEKDIWAPVKSAKGDYEWQVLYHQGQHVNPLEYQRPHNAMLFFDGTSKEQVAFVASAVERYPGKLMVIEATGANPEGLTQQLHVPVFTVTQAMANRFDLSRTPSLLYPGEKEHRLELGFTTFGPPFKLGELEQTWPEGFKSGAMKP